MKNISYLVSVKPLLKNVSYFNVCEAFLGASQTSK